MSITVLVNLISSFLGAIVAFFGIKKYLNEANEKITRQIVSEELKGVKDRLDRAHEESQNQIHELTENAKQLYANEIQRIYDKSRPYQAIYQYDLDSARENFQHYRDYNGNGRIEAMMNEMEKFRVIQKRGQA